MKFIPLILLLLFAISCSAKKVPNPHETISSPKEEHKYVPRCSTGTSFCHRWWRMQKE